MSKKRRSQQLQERHYFVQGMHCPSCELVVERELARLPGVASTQADAGRGEVTIRHSGREPDLEALNRLFAEQGYRFSEERPPAGSAPHRQRIVALAAAGGVLVGLALLERLGLSGLVNPTVDSSLPAIFALGLLAGVSSCAALAGGVLLTLCGSQPAAGPGSEGHTTALGTPIWFNAGRLLSYSFLGAVLGAAGSRLMLTPSVASALVLLVAVVMAVTGLKMMGLPPFTRFNLALPKAIGARIGDGGGPGRRQRGAFVVGALTFFLPCGFTLSAQGLAVLSGSPLRGALIMTAFALGTLPSLLGIGISATRLSLRPALAGRFAVFAGALVVAFAVYAVNGQLNVLGLPSLSDIRTGRGRVFAASRGPASDSATSVSALAGATVYSSVPTPSLVGADPSLPPVVEGAQVIRMDASASAYTPNFFRVRAGVPVRWEITDRGVSGCTNAIIARGLLPDLVPLQAGGTTVTEFTPTREGRYKFSCWMGMVSGVIEVVSGSA